MELLFERTNVIFSHINNAEINLEENLEVQKYKEKISTNIATWRLFPAYQFEI